MGFEALDDFLDETLTLPIKGREYVIEAPSAEVGLRTQAIVQAAAIAADGGRANERVLADAAERDMYADLLGPAYEQMIADGVKWPRLKHAALTAMVWVVQSREQAERYWNLGGDPKAAAPNRASRRSQEARSGGASTTRNQGSGSGTSTRPARRRGGKASAARR
ncbi:MULTISPECIES: hypothetical protein [unclassified Streptomyces]|uniref:DUF7426 family protein n=1 Tax=unclassified Streptomyces TaxID=2593676 RepID=UPI000361EFB2|nr:MULTISPECIES: hypothetical protein [unclassified Streptomyces]MYX36724.1 hypothetical protein [Streptomyces sp. SID8377]